MGLDDLMSMQFVFMLTNSADPDEIMRSDTFYLGRQCFPRYQCRNLSVYKGLIHISIASLLWKKYKS